MKKNELLSYVRQLTPRDQLELMQILVEELKQVVLATPPQPQGGGISLAAGQGMGRMTPEATMQLSVNDLIYTDDEIAGLTSTQSEKQSTSTPAGDRAGASNDDIVGAGEANEVVAGPEIHETKDVGAEVASELAAMLDLASTSAAGAPVVPKPAPGSHASSVGVVKVALAEPLVEEPDEDRVFESLIMELTGDEMRVMETLSAVKKHFWAPLQEAFQALHVGSLRLAVETMQVAPMRIAIGEVVNASISALVHNYHDFLHQHLTANQLSAASHRSLFVTKKNQDQLVLSLRTPFRQYVERLERLDQARDELLESLEGADKTLADAPLFDEARKAILASRSGAAGVGLAWQAVHDAILATKPDEGGEAIEGFAETLQQFLGHLDDLYDTVLYRVLELWNAHLLAPARNALPDL